MEFQSSNGLRLQYWFSGGEVIASKSWIYRGEWHHETWVRNDDGSEWRSTAGLLGIAVNRGQRLAFAWCAANDSASGDLVAVRNCTTGETRTISSAIAREYDRRAYGRWGMLLAFLAISFFWQSGLARELPAVVSTHWLASSLTILLATGFIGFTLSSLVDPDPERQVDQRIQIALAGMAYAWRQLQADAAIGRKDRQVSATHRSQMRGHAPSKQGKRAEDVRCLS